MESKSCLMTIMGIIMTAFGFLITVKQIKNIDRE